MAASRKRRTEEHKLLIASLRIPERFRQGMFQGFALGIEGLPGRGWNRKVSGVGENQAESLQDIPNPQSALP
jgi:hypothetical protein